jgi:hypothetical protein
MKLSHGPYIVKVINLDSRPERMDLTTVELQNFGFDHIFRFPAISGGESGCAKSHYECLKGDGLLFLFEDDIIFEVGAGKILTKAMAQLPDDFDLLYLGANVKTPANQYSKNLFKITGGVHCTHAILYSDKGRHRMLDLWRPEKEVYRQIDHWLYMKGQGLMECYVCSPLIAFQRPDYSDIRLQYFDYRDEMLENQRNNMNASK